MTVTVRQLAELVHGAILGDADLIVRSARTLQDAQPGDITFLDSAKNAGLLRQSKASAAVVPANVTAEGKTLIQVADPLGAFIAIVQQLQGKTAAPPVGIDPRAVVHFSAKVGADPSIQPTAVVGANTVVGDRCRLAPGVVIGNNCRVGHDVVLHPNVVLYDDTILGDRVIIHANSTIGADGFGYRFQKGRHVKIPQLGNVVIGNDVEIGANTCVDRATFGSTTIGDGTKIDNFVQIAHNCRIGKHNALASQVGIAGSCVLGDYVVMGGQSGVKDHIHIGDGAMIGAKSGVIHDVPPGGRMFLYPAFEEKEAARVVACLKRLPNMRKDLLRMLKELDLQETTDAPTTKTPEAPAA